VFAKGQNIIQSFEKLAPKYLAEEDDSIGLQVGTLNKEVKSLMLTLDVLEETVNEAIAKKIDLLIAHHPVIYKPIKNLRTDLPQGRLLEKLIKNDIAVYVAHSNLDSTLGGVSDAIAERLGIAATGFLAGVYTELTGKEYGIGRLGMLPEPHILKDFADFVKEKLDLNGVKIVGDIDRPVKKVAIVGGDGNKFVNKAVYQGADVLLTGDIYYHVAHEAMAQGLAIIDIGHNVEKVVLPKIQSFLAEEFIKKRIDTEIIISETNSNPFQFR